MAALTDYLENAALNHIFRGITYTPPVGLYVALFTTPTTDSLTIGGAGQGEVSGGSYARIPVVFGAPSGGAITNTGTLTFPTATAGWGTIVAVAIFDALTNGNALMHGALPVSRTVNNGDTVVFSPSTLTLTLA